MSIRFHSPLLEFPNRPLFPSSLPSTGYKPFNLQEEVAEIKKELLRLSTEIDKTNKFIKVIVDPKFFINSPYA